jgi:hypothetical protein
MFEKFVSEILDSGLATEQEVKPCSEEDVASFNESTGSISPVTYEQFLLKIGKEAGRFMQGTDIFYPGIKGLKNEAIALLEENEEEFELPEDSFVFSMHQGYEFLYFKLSEGDDLGVYQYVEGNGTSEKVWGSFTEFMEQSLKQHIQE